MHEIPRLSLRLYCLALVCISVLGCSNLGSATDRLATAATPYKMDVIQGNVVTKEQVAYLKPGMPRATVRDVLGSALLTSVFHADRWDYVFTLKRLGAEAQSRKVTVFFVNDLLDRIEADDLPSESEFVTTLRSGLSVKPEKLPALDASEESLSKFPAPAKRPAAELPVPAAPVRYPPLEPSR
ncbi:outer membrane protein assembly factor BamE [Rhodoferax aquaticus]|uniref:Outer membrane protein assembly factor BamE n=1 Tax=Rhodoferax aquaticus TaxID=2527691 RepID=A0A515EKG3_9BURK|nr:outer membrane protein assembly factor BamE [Rhodoferax aquaticus]QDL53157.1 outer membrane protein assembly factor BamE [Rhodoferax aquaticus]